MLSKGAAKILWMISLTAMLLCLAFPVSSTLLPRHFTPIPHWSVFYDENKTMVSAAYWGKDDYLPHNGSYSAWCARDGANGVDPENFNYSPFLDSWMVYGPFDLQNYDGARLDFYYLNQSEEDFDYFEWLASIDGSLINSFRGNKVSGNSTGWQDISFDLSAVPELGDLTGFPLVWVAFRFSSDESNNDVPFEPIGAFVDDIVLRARSTMTGEWEVLMSEDFEGVFPIALEKIYSPFLSKAP